MGKATNLTQSEREMFGPQMRTERRVEEIEADIEKTRAGLEGTVDEIKERFSPGHVKSQVRDATIGKAKRMIRRSGERAKQMSGRVVERVKTSAFTRTITDNPIPAALAGVGLGWLIMNGLRRSKR